MQIGLNQKPKEQKWNAVEFLDKDRDTNCMRNISIECPNVQQRARDSEKSKSLNL